MMVMGVPAKVRGPVSETLKQGQNERIGHYVQLKERYRRGDYPG
jgi:hypothetical protein